jgi:anti-anti-sigma regulatory factor
MPWIVEIESDTVRLTFSGAAAIADAGALRAELLQLAGEARPVVLDLTRCTGIDTAVVQLLLAFHGARAERGAPVRFVLGSGPAAALLERLRVAALVVGMEGSEMAPRTPPSLGSTPGNPGRSSR